MPWMDILWSTLAGAAVLFVWGAVCWIVLPHHFGDWKQLPNEAELDAALAKSAPAPELYLLPHWGPYPKGMKDAGFRERFKRGPNAHVYVLRDVMEQGATFAKGFVLNALVAFTCAVLLHQGGFGATGFAPTVGFFALLGALVHGVLPAQHAIWMGYPRRPVMTGLFDGVAGFALLGVVLHLLR